MLSSLRLPCLHSNAPLPRSAILFRVTSGASRSPFHCREEAEERGECKQEAGLGVAVEVSGRIRSAWIGTGDLFPGGSAAESLGNGGGSIAGVLLGDWWEGGTALGEKRCSQLLYEALYGVIVHDGWSVHTDSNPGAVHDIIRI